MDMVDIFGSDIIFSEMFNKLSLEEKAVILQQIADEYIKMISKQKEDMEKNMKFLSEYALEIEGMI